METQPTACRWCGAKGDEPHDGATHDAYAASDPPGVGYNSGARDADSSHDSQAASTADELEEIITALFDIAETTVTDDLESDRLARLYGRSAMLLRRLRRQAEAASSLENGGTLRD